MAPKLNDYCPSKRRHRQKKKPHRNTVEKVICRNRNWNYAASNLELPEAGRDKKGFSRGFRGSAALPHLDFEPLVYRSVTINFYCFKPPCLW